MDTNYKTIWILSLPLEISNIKLKCIGQSFPALAVLWDNKRLAIFGKN